MSRIGKLPIPFGSGVEVKIEGGVVRVKGPKGTLEQQVVPRILDQIQTKARAYGSLVGVEYGEAFVRSQAIPIRLSDPDSLIESEV